MHIKGWGSSPGGYSLGGFSPGVNRQGGYLRHSIALCFLAVAFQDPLSITIIVIVLLKMDVTIK